MRVTKKYLDELTYKVIGCAIEDHKILGPGLLESVYERFFTRELTLQGIGFKKQQNVPLNYKGELLEAELRLDILTEDILCIELKARECLLPVHEAILLSYMQMLQKPKGILINFQCVNFQRRSENISKQTIFSTS